jgi:hypothetical protein
MNAKEVKNMKIIVIDDEEELDPIDVSCCSSGVYTHDTDPPEPWLLDLEDDIDLDDFLM